MQRNYLLKTKIELVKNESEIKTLEEELSELLKTKQKILMPGMMTTGQTGGDEESISEKRNNITKTKSKFHLC